MPATLTFEDLVFIILAGKITGKVGWLSLFGRI
jgi:hypothetical protein